MRSSALLCVPVAATCVTTTTSSAVLTRVWNPPTQGFNWGRGVAHGTHRVGGSSSTLTQQRPSPVLMSSHVSSALAARGGADRLTDDTPSPQVLTSLASRGLDFLNKRFFLVGVACAVAFARLAPAVGATGGLLRPEITVNKAGVAIIFFLVGLSTRLGELAGAALNVRLNLLVQLFSFVALPGLGWLLSIALRTGGAHPALADGVLILMALPTTINMSIILTQSAEGNAAAAAFNAVLGNLLGLVLTPLLILMLMGQRSETSPKLLGTLNKLGLKVVLPVVLGQLARLVSSVRDFQVRNKKAFSRVSECVLILIILTTFSDTFIANATGKSTLGGSIEVLALVALLPLVHVASLATVGFICRVPFLQVTERDRIAAMYAASHKTLAFGMPLIKTMFEGYQNLGLLATPLLIFHPTELIIGSAMAPFLRERAAARSRGQSGDDNTGSDNSRSCGEGSSVGEDLKERGSRGLDRKPTIQARPSQEE